MSKIKQIVPDISVDKCAEALEFYQEVFGGEIKNLQKAEVNEMFKDHAGKIVHSELHINPNCVMYFVDYLNGKKQTGNISLILQLDSEEEINRMYQALSKDGVVTYELQKTFWGAYHAVVTDRFGVTWGLNFAQQ